MTVSLSAAELPSNVAWFERLMYLALGISLIQTFLLWDYVVDDFANDYGYPGRALTFLVMLVLFALFGFLIWQTVRKRKNWARLVLTIVIVIQLSPFYRWTNISKYHGHGLLGMTPLDQGLMIGQNLVLAIALCLIFTGNARSWFRESV
jgi:hypothetical protein